MTPRRSIPALVAVASMLALAACCRENDSSQGGSAALAWSRDCPPLVRPAPLSLEAAREAYRQAERRHELKLREAAAPGSFLRSVKQQDAGGPCLSALAETGQQLFDHEFGFADGLGGGQGARSPQGPFRRVHSGVFGGPETISCTSCHWVGGPNGAGAETDNAFLSGDGVDTTSGDARNSPALVALGVVEALAREMSRDLAAQREDLVRVAADAGEARERALVTKGVEFGVLRATARGEVDTRGVEGVDPDLVVRPFGWKGTRADIASFATEALQVHLGLQGERLAADGVEATGSGPAEDPDGDGVRDEFGSRPMAALAVHLALLELPIVEPLVQDRDLDPAATGLLAPTRTSFVGDFARGRAMFHATGCATCHRPMLLLDRPVLELEGLPPIDLAGTMRRPALHRDDALGGWPVWLFSDLKRHDMGRANRARHEQRGVARELYLTPRLWGLADSAPYLHDGRAPSFDYAIAGHDGEGRRSRRAFFELPDADRGALRVYLMSMRRAPRVTVP